MFTTTQVICAVAVGLTVGLLAGTVAYEVLRTATERRRRILAERRARELVLRLTAANDRADANAYLVTILAKRAGIEDTHLGSRRAADLRVV